MKKAKYYFDPESLTFRQESKSVKEKSKIVLSFGLKALLIFIAASVVFSYTDYSLKVPFLEKEKQIIIERYKRAESQLFSLSNTLHSFVEKDENSYRVIAELDPVSGNVREAGYGGAEQYPHFQGLNSSDFVIGMLKRTDQLIKQLLIQQASYGEIYNSVLDKKKKVASIPGILPLSGKDLMRISDPFGMRFHPIYKTRKMHYGIDFKAEEGAPVFCPGEGVVVQSDFARGYGKTVVIDHGYGVISLYAHLSEMLVKNGQFVTRGQLIGKVGDTGSSTGSHLHYEVRLSNKPVNPANFYVNDLSPEEYDEIVVCASTKR